MPDHNRRVSFEDQVAPEAHKRRTRGPSRRRARSADRVHTIWDDMKEMQKGRERVVDREAYDKLLREINILKLDNLEKDRELQQYAAWAQQLQRENQDLQELLSSRASTETTTTTTTGGSGVAADESNEGSRRARLRRKNALPELEIGRLTEADLLGSRKQAAEWRQLYEAERRRYEDVSRRLDRLRENIDLRIQAQARLEEENAELRRALDLANRLRRQ